MSSFAAGATLGRYRIVSLLGTGAMGEVYLAEDPQIGRQVALKTLRMVGVHAAELDERRQRLLREAQTAGRLNHPHVVTLYDAGEDEGFVYLAFELVSGSDLAARIAAGPPLTLGEALRWVSEACRGLDHAHQAGIVHRDIKPSNLMLDAEQRLKISDFGIAKISGQATELTVTGSVMGSPFYLSPEQVRGEELDGRSDLFSLGVVLYEILCRKRPFDGETISTLVYQILQAEPVPLGTIRPDLPERLAVLVDSMLAKERDGRPATAGLVASELNTLLGRLGPAALAAPAAGGDAAEGPTRRLETQPGASAPLPPPPPPAPAPASPPAPPQTASASDAVPPPAPTAPTTPAAPTPAPATPVSGSPPVSPTVPVDSAAPKKRRWLLPLVGCGAVAMALAVGVVLLISMGLPLDPRKVLDREEPAVTAEAAPGAETSGPEAGEGAAPGDLDSPINGGWVEEPGESDDDPNLPEAAEEPDPGLPRPGTPVPPPPDQPSDQPPPDSPRAAPPDQGPADPVPAPGPAAADPAPESAPPTADPDPGAPPGRPAGRQPPPDTGLTSGLSLTFRVMPPDAFVLVDGTVIGRAAEWGRDGRTYVLPGPGTYDVTLRKGGMRDRRIRIMASGDRSGTTTVAARLEPLPADEVELGDLEVHRAREAIGLRVKPRNAMVIVDGRRVGQASRVGRRGWLELPRGMHRITLVAPGYQRVDLAVEITGGAVERRVRIEVDMQRASGGS